LDDPGLGLLERLRMRHRFLRYRYRTERSSLDYVRRFVPRGATVLDVGTNRGIWTWWLSRTVGPSGRVVGFDPQPEAIASVRTICDAFGCTNVDLVPMALSDTPGVSILARHAALDGGAHLVAREDGTPQTPADDRDEEHLRVETTPLDDACAKLDVHDVRFVKIDVEGHELAVLRGATRLLERDHPALLIEIADDRMAAGEVTGLLEAAGYRGFFLVGKRRTPVSAYAEHPHRKPWENRRNYIFESVGG